MKYKIAYILFLAACSVLIGLWMFQICTGVMPGLDIVTRPFAEQSKTFALYPFFRRMTVFGSSSFLIPVCLAAAFVIWGKYRRIFPAVIFVTGALAGWVLNHGMKALVQRARPTIDPLLDAVGSSFPSGHAMSSMICYGLFAYFFGNHIASRTGRVLLYTAVGLMILLIGLSRYVLNVHYLTDVLAGYFFGYLFLVFWLRLYRRAKKNH